MYRLEITLMSVSGIVWGHVTDAAQQRLQAMAQQLKLTPDQKSRILPILNEEIPKVKAVREDTSLPRNEKVSKLMDIRNETNSKIEPILSPEQQKKLESLKKETRKQPMADLKAKAGRL